MAMKYAEIKETYERMLPLYRQLQEEVNFIINQALEGTTMKIHTMASRVKQFKSFIDKVKAKQYKKPFEEINDIVGVRIVCLFLSDIGLIGEVVRDTFDVLREDNRIEDYKTSSFGYLSVHFIATLKKECKGPRYNKIKNIPFEIQVRTIAMDSWATISHYLDYKNEAGVPKDLRRDFYALSGLFYVADTHFEMFYNQSKEFREKMRKIFEDKQLGLKQEINLDSLLVYLHQKFPDREHTEPEDVSELVTELKLYGYNKISDVDNSVKKAWDAFLKHERDYPPRDMETSAIVKFVDVGIIRDILALLDDRFRKAMGYKDNYSQYRKYLKK